MRVDGYADERQECRRLALQVLEFASQAEPKQEVARLREYVRLWRYPTFDVWRSWTVFRGEAGLVLVRQVTWDSLTDRGRFWDPLEGLRLGLHTKPTISVLDRPVPSAFEAHLVNVPAVPFPVGPFGICLDGEGLGLELLGLPSIRLEWNGNEPREWSELMAWHCEAVELLG